MVTLIALLEKFDNKTQDANTRFKPLAKELLSNYQIKSVSGIRYDIEEIEFYFFNQHHKDTSTHRHEMNAGLWRIHYSGIDITFQGYKEIPKSCTSTKCKVCHEYCKYSYGGILIRSISTQQETIVGPLRVQTTLLSGGRVEGGSGLQLIKQKAKDIKLEGTKRYGVNNPEDFKDLKYGFYNSGNTELSAVIKKRKK